MEIITGKNAGFCYGVEIAVNGAKKELEKIDGARCSLGEIVHNKQVVDEMEEKGMQVVEDLSSRNKKVIVRAHGVPKDIYVEAKNKDIELIDYTCPNVLKIHKIADKYLEEVDFVILVGQKKHPENIGTISHCGEKSKIIETKDEIKEAISEIEKVDSKSVLLIVQTTYSLEKFKEIEEEIIEELEKIKVSCISKNTICKATEIRQEETREISKEVDFMIIVGGKKSSNTKKLYEIAKQNCEKSVLIETVEELEFIDGIQKVGIMAGASTPKKSIEDVQEYLKKFN